MKKAGLFPQIITSYGFGVAVFALFMFLAIHYLIVYPATKRMANDFSSLIILSAQTWLELPPETRSDFEHELYLSHDLSIGLPTSSVEGERTLPIFISMLEESLSWQLDKPVKILAQHRNGEHWFWTDIPIANHTLRASFSEQRFTSNYTSALLISTLAGFFIVTLLTAITAYRLTKPIKTLIKATRKIGIQDEKPNLPVSSIKEIDELAASFDRLDGKIKKLLNGRNILLSGISHDLRTPLARMALALEMIKTKEQDDLKEQMLADIDIMNAIIGQTLQLSKDMIPQDIETIDLHDFLTTLIHTYSNSPVSITLKSSNSDTHIKAARVPLQRILGNLIENAIKHSHARHIWMTHSLNRRDSTVAISVSDDGIGIDEHLREDIFLPFFKKDASRSKSGSGLGLSIVEQLANVYGWKIELMENKPSGSRFILTVPLAT